MAEIIQVTYRAADGTVWPLQMDKLIRIKTANFHNWTFNPETMMRKFGVRVLYFGKEAAAYQTSVYFGGAIAGRKTRIDSFHTEIERDVRNTTPGRLTWGSWYVNCFIRSSSTYPDPQSGYTVNDIEIYVPYPFWISPRTYNFYPETGEETQSTWLDYEYGYEYDYTPRSAGSGEIRNTAPGSARFKMVFYGPAINPYVYIGQTRYMVNISLAEGELLEIDSMNQTVTKILQGGERINAFNNREKGDTSIFEPIPVGRSSVIWPASVGLELTVYQERSEPAWS